MTLPAVLRERLRIPVLGAPLFIVSGPELVIAQCKAGVVGSFNSLNARTDLRSWLTQITEALAKHDAENPDSPAAPYAVNLIVHKSNERLYTDLAVVEEFQVPIVITSLGAIAEVNSRIHAYGGFVLHDVIDDRFARKAVERGADGIVAVAAGAGGHTGSQSPFALVQEIRSWFDGPLVLSGAIATGGAVLAAQAVGADLAYVGTLFIATEEANAVDGYKQLIVDSTAADIVHTNVFTGVHANYLRGSIEAAGLDPAALAGATPASVDFGGLGGDREVKAWRDIWGSGQGIGAITAVARVADVVERLAAEYAAARARLAAIA
jgi:nitronate monooxygenase